MAQNATGRHRAPGRYNPLAELKVIAKESAQPAVKGAAIVAASGGLIATVANPASASDAKPPAVAADAVVNAAVAGAPAAVGPDAAVTEASNALMTIGFKPAAAPKAKPLVIEDLVVKQERAEAAAKAEEARQQAAERAAAARTQQAASRSSDRTALTAASAPTSKPASNPAPAASGIVGIAQSMFGVPYAYGGTSPSGFDCSGFTSWVYRQAGISIPRTASAQQSAATRVSSPQPGDLVFFGYPAYHVGIYVSPGRMIDAQRPGTTVGNHSIWTTPSGYGRMGR
ncbi:NLP/P60 protein [Intrasporangium chromatireducens Q5-1]|uniref:NLP/P60 protein n=1 Tax=Intrasporangium chromatireducens Q5-1 TaxID=584657 RepID=W9GPD7_9MICO|nr:C40 family peptidase [Intrasporangium chromatireducens]EWT05759.1 NLP/P60 protein [Intrasporangium chromatireducens Q5-1]